MISDVLRWTPSHGRVRVGWPARTYQQQFCTDTESSLEDLPEAMDDWDEWWDRARKIRASVKLRSASWWAVWLPHFFSFCPRNSYYEVQQIRRKEWWKMNIWLSLFPELLWTISPFSSCSKSLPMAYYKGIMTFFTWARMKAKPKKSRSLSLVRGSVEEINFKNWGW